MYIRKGDAMKMKRNSGDLFKLFVLVNLLILALMGMPEHPPVNDYPIVTTQQLNKDIAMVANNIKSNR